MNIVYGGAFNPPSIAHYEIVKRLKKLGNVIILPVGLKYHKDSLINDDVRLDMVKILAKSTGAIISDLELHNEQYRGTYHTLLELAKSFDDIHFVMGADNLVNLNKWINYQALVRDFKFIIITRDDIDCSKIIEENFGDFREHFTIMNLDMDVSSTEIRENVLGNRNLLLPEIYDYIVKNSLYEVK